MQQKGKAIPAKVGTQPMMIVLDGRSNVTVGKAVRFREAKHGSKWERGRVRAY